MAVWFIPCGKKFDGYILEAFRVASDFQVVNNGLFEIKFKEYLRSCRKRSSRLTIIVDINDRICIQAITTLLRLVGKADLSELKLLAITSFASWGAKRVGKTIVDVSTAFRDRLPLASAFDQFASENALEHAALQTNVWLRLIGCGLFYGGDGLDLKEHFMRVWRNEQFDTIMGDLNGSAVPVVHISSFVRLVLDLAQNNGSADGDVFVPAVDCPVLEGDNAVIPLGALITRFAAILNKGAMGSPGTELVTPLSPVWNCHLPFASSPVQGNLLSDVTRVWSEFLAANALQPLSVLLAGPPRMGKSEIAAAVAARLGVEVVTPESAVKFLFRQKGVEGLPAEVAAGVSAAIAEVKAAAEAKAAEGKKPAKGAPVAEEGVIDEAVFTFAFCQGLPVELVRKCVSAQVRLSPACCRRGFVLDLWDGRTVTNRASLREALNGIYETLDQPGLSETVELVAELQCPTGMPVERLVASQGAQAKAKESQAAVKALESLVAAYASSLVPLPAPPAGGPAHLSVGLPGVIELGDIAGTAVCRVDCAAAEGGSVEAAATSVFTAAVTARQGRIGWLSGLASSSASSAGEPKLESAVDDHDEGSSTSVGNGGDGVQEVQASVASSPSVAERVAQLDAAKRSVLAARSEKLESFLTASILPRVASGLVQIQRERPEDPILFLAEHLLQHSAANNRQAEDKARARFIELLHQGGF